MAAVVDTNVFIEIERRGQSLNALTPMLAGEPFGIATITVAELLAGVYRTESPARRGRREAFVQAVLDSAPALSFDLRAASIYAQVLAELTSRGQVIGTFDLMIASTALANGYSVITFNIREFERVPGLEVRQPNW